MDDGLVLLVWLFVIGWWGVMGVVAGIVASNKNRSVLGWVLLVELFAPTILILLALRPPVAQEVSLRSLAARSRPASTGRSEGDPDPAIHVCAGCGAKWGRTATRCFICGHALPQQNRTE